jgi:hypothetical protein
MQAVPKVAGPPALQAHGHTARLGLGVEYQFDLCHGVKRRIKATQNLQ